MITRDAFLYMEPPAGYYKPEAFAQCETCRKYVPGSPDKCIELGPYVEVGSGYSCGLYSNWPIGRPNTKVIQDHRAELVASAGGNSFVKAEAAGLVERQVRCENRTYFNGSDTCNLYAKLNKAFPAMFSLDPNVRPLACCNGQTP